MALTKSLTLPNGQTGNYIQVGAYSWDRLTREVSAHFMLFTSAAFAASAPDAPICLLAKLRLTGDKFDEYLGAAALAALDAGIKDPVRYQLYEAVKVEPIVAGGGFRQDTLSLADATQA